MGVGFLLNSSIRGRKRNLILGSKKDFYASGSFLCAINDHVESSGHNRDRWIVDYEANGHVCDNTKWLLNPVDLFNEEVHICLPNEKKITIESYGDFYLKFDQGSFIIRKFAYVTKLSISIISVAKLHEEGFKVLFDDHVTIMRENITPCVGREKQRPYEYLELIEPRAYKTTILKFEQMISKVKDDHNVVMWHKRLAHMKLPESHVLMDSHYLFNMKMLKKLKCSDCKGLKPHSHPLVAKFERAT